MRGFIATTAAIAALAGPAIAHAAPGDLDGSFSTDGLQVGDAPAPARAVAVTGDGSIAVAGTTDGTSNGFAVAAYSAAGDPSWVQPLTGVGAAVEAEPGGTLLAGGWQPANGDFVLARLGADDGVPQPTFGDSGIVTTDFGLGGDRLTDLAVAPDGSIAAAGIVAGPDGEHLGVARYQADGGPLPGFGTDGRWTAPEGGGFGTDASIALLADGSAIVAGAGPAPDGSSTGDLLVLKLTPSGTLDPAFGSGDGWLAIDVAGRDDARSLAILGDGRIVVGFEACAFGLHTSCDPSVARLTPAGTLDSSFGAGGLVVGTSGFEIADGGGGRVLVAGTSTPLEYFRRDFTIARLLADGGQDAGFGAGVASSVDFDLTEDIAAALAAGPDGRPVLAGGVGATSHGVARFETADGPRDADADGVLDSADRCPKRYGRHPKTGCPKVSRKLKLRKRHRKLEVKLKADLAQCAGRQKVRLARVKGRKTRIVARARTARQGKARLGAQRSGRYRATVKANVVPELARCSRAKSKVKRIR